MKSLEPPSVRQCLLGPFQSLRNKFMRCSKINWTHNIEVFRLSLEIAYTHNKLYNKLLGCFRSCVAQPLPITQSFKAKFLHRGFCASETRICGGGGRIVGNELPCPSFLLDFWDFLDKFKKQGISLDILAFSLSFPRMLWVPHRPKILGNFEVFLGKNLSAPKSQRFLRFAIAMPTVDPRNRSDFRDKRKQCCITI